jgi:succinate-semialdehyde dehydrogenase / glutarate-semialdehyde dehydrogenase
MSIKTINPTDNQFLAEYQHHSLNEAFEKIRNFSKEQKTWSQLPVASRSNMLKKIAQSLLSQKEIFAKQAALEMGKPITQGIAEVEKCAGALETIADLAVENLNDQEIKAHYRKTVIRPEAYGLVLSIQPWNFPYWQAFRMAACAWMAGNLVVLKHSEEVAGCAELIEKACVVEGKRLLLNLRLTHSDAAEVIKSSLIQAVTFTGSSSGGKKVGQTAGSAIKKCILELGGSDAYIVMPDCDLDLAAKVGVQSRLTNSGQSCIAAKRFFVHEKIFQEYKNKFKVEMQKYKIGNPLEKETQVGPLSAPRFVQSLLEQTKRANFAGAKLDWIPCDLPQGGCFTHLGILDFGSNLKVFENEEIFGPVACFYRFDSLDEVIQVVNGGPFGLGSGIFTQDMELAERVSKEVSVGTFTVNSFVQSDARVPFGGFKESGVGREMGLAGLHDFVNWKVVGMA